MRITTPCTRLNWLTVFESTYRTAVTASFPLSSPRYLCLAKKCKNWSLRRYRQIADGNYKMVCPYRPIASDKSMFIGEALLRLRISFAAVLAGRVSAQRRSRQREDLYEVD